MIDQDENDLCSEFNSQLKIFQKLYSKRVSELKKQDMIFHKSLKII